LIGIALLGIVFKDLVSGDWQSVANSLLTNLNPYDFTPVMGCFSACHISGKKRITRLDRELHPEKWLCTKVFRVSVNQIFDSLST
jgi:hypothetical protein